MFKVISAAALVIALSATPAAAATPTLGLSTTVAMPGQAVAVTLTGTPGQNWALIGSTVNRGFIFGGVPLNVGNDVTILAAGTLDGTGTVTVPVTPPFIGTTLDRYYLQAVTSASPGFVPLEASQGAIIRNGELVAGLTGPQGAAGPPGLAGVVTVQANGTVAANATSGAQFATCPTGKVAIGGGVGSGNINLRIYTSIPSGNAWFGVVKYFDNGTAATSAVFTVYAVCATVAP